MQIGIGILCIFIGGIIILLYGDYKRIPNAKKTKGSIYLSNQKQLGKGKILFYHQIHYFVDSKEYFIQMKGRRRYFFRNPKNITIKYNKENPSQAMVLHNFIDYIIPLLWIGFGILEITLIILSQSHSESTQMNPKKGDCCVCSSCPQCAVCCSCDNP